MWARERKTHAYQEPLPLDCFQAWGRELYMLGALEARRKFFEHLYKRLRVASIVGAIILFAITLVVEGRYILASASSVVIAAILLIAMRIASKAHLRTRKANEDLRRLLRVTKLDEPWRMTPTEDEKTNQILDLCEFLIDTENLGRHEAMRHATSLVDRGDDLQSLWARANQRNESMAM